MMEEYEDLENGAPDATDATTTTRGHENEAQYQGIDIARQLESEIERNHGSSAGFLKTTNEWKRGQEVEGKTRDAGNHSSKQERGSDHQANRHPRTSGGEISHGRMEAEGHVGGWT